MHLLASSSTDGSTQTGAGSLVSSASFGSSIDTCMHCTHPSNETKKAGETIAKGIAIVIGVPKRANPTIKLK